MTSAGWWWTGRRTEGCADGREGEAVMAGSRYRTRSNTHLLNLLIGLSPSVRPSAGVPPRSLRCLSAGEAVWWPCCWAGRRGLAESLTLTLGLCASCEWPIRLRPAPATEHSSRISCLMPHTPIAGLMSCSSFRTARRPVLAHMRSHEALVLREVRGGREEERVQRVRTHAGYDDTGPGLIYHNAFHFTTPTLHAYGSGYVLVSPVRLWHDSLSCEGCAHCSRSVPGGGALKV
ncbi:hypothetical protein OH77DRAFT_175163 [Trametes cingulata]|nr:hypothetical protein OH77DRAFT_175163 [Trametes cingulata]